MRSGLQFVPAASVGGDLNCKLRCFQKSQPNFPVTVRFDMNNAI
jgi:hypothetical protein